MPSWEQFQNQHVLDPTVDPGYVHWNRQQWNDWLRNRIQKFGSKKINSVVIGTPQDIERSFESPTHGYSQQNFFWSNDEFELVFMTLIGGRDPPYDVQRLGRMYFLALIDPDPNRPVHFHGQGTNRVPSGQTPKSFDARRLD